jgi:glutamate racemase
LKVAIDENKNQNILIMATPATINSEKFLHFYYTYYTPNIKLLPCPNLANLIENNKQNEIDLYLKNILNGFENIDVIVFGCTHYLYIKENIKKILKNVKFID